MLQDVRLACRSLIRNPGFTVVTMLTLALGIGANAAIFSVVDRVLLRPAPVDDLQRLVMLWETDRNTGTTREPASVPDFIDFRERSATLDRVMGIIGGELNLTPPSGEPLRIPALHVSHDLLPTLGIAPVAGRLFTREEDQPGGPAVAVVSESLWQRVFARDPATVGRAISLDERPYTVVGVVPDEADFGVVQLLSAAAYARAFVDRGGQRRVDVWMPLKPDPKSLPRSTHPVLLVGRLAAHSSVAAAQQELAGIAADLEHTYPVNAARGVFIEPFSEVVFGPVRQALLVLLGAVVLVLLVACVNVAHLLLARGETRAREVAVRAALGGGRARLARQFLTENLLLSLVSALAGLLLAYVAVRALVALAPADVPRMPQASIDLRVLAVTSIVAVVAGLVFGMLPFVQAMRLDLQTILKGEGGGVVSSVRGGGLRSLLVVTEVALAVVLVFAAGLLIRSFWQLRQVDPGFRVAGVLKAEYQLPASRYVPESAKFPDAPAIQTFNDRLTARVSRLPGVEGVAIAANHPLDPGFTNSFAIVGREAEAKGWPEISIRRVSPGYFRTLDVPLLKGRSLAEADGPPTSPVVVINEAAAQRFFEARDPVGARMRFWGAERTIVGVVGNERIHGLTARAPIAVYAPLAQAPSTTGVLLVRSSSDPSALARPIRAAIHELDSALAVFGVEPLDTTVTETIAKRRFTMLLLAVFAAVALVLAAVGIHGVLSLGVARRTREIGLRVALGAQPARLVALIVRQGVFLTLVGLLVGLGLSLAAGRVLASLLFGVVPTDGWTLFAVAICLIVVAALTSLIPARRATRISPMVALRSE